MYVCKLAMYLNPFFRFIYADVGAEGRMSDGGIYTRSTLCTALMNNLMNLPPAKPVAYDFPISLPHVILADEAFPLTTNVMRPYPQRVLNHDKRIFNYRLSRARRVIENSFGILTATWRVFEHKLPLQPAKVTAITKACVVLHNYLLTSGQQGNLTVDTDTVSGNWRHLPAPNGLIDFNNLPLRPTATAQEVRNHFTTYFNGPGKVDWQEQAIS